jgi:hypothetical protein
MSDFSVTSVSGTEANLKVGGVQSVKLVPGGIEVDTVNGEPFPSSVGSGSVLFGASASAATTIGNGVFTQVNFANELVDTHAAFASSAFTAPAAGWYQVNAAVGHNATTTCAVAIYVDGVLAYRGSEGSADIAVVATMLHLDAGDVVTIRLLQNSGGSTTTQTGSATYFNGFLVKAD